MDSNLKDAVTKFIKAFEQVFDEDWEYTKSNLNVEDYISPKGTFINPKVEDEIEDWGNRALLLKEYRRLKNLLSGI